MITFVRTLGIIGLLLLGVGGWSTLAQAGGKEGVVIQVSDNDPKLWNLALNVAQNVQAARGKDKVDIEVVAFGPGLGMLKFDSPVGNRLKQANADGIGFRACANTMQKTKVSEKDLYDGVKMVPAGVIHIMDRQAQGWRYVKM